MHNGEKTPLIRLAKRESMPAAAQWGIRIAAILLALVVGGLVILLIVLAALFVGVMQIVVVFRERGGFCRRSSAFVSSFSDRSSTASASTTRS